MEENRRWLLLWLLLNRQNICRTIVNYQREMSDLCQLSLYNKKTNKYKYIKFLLGYLVLCEHMLQTFKIIY